MANSVLEGAGTAPPQAYRFALLVGLVALLCRLRSAANEQGVGISNLGDRAHRAPALHELARVCFEIHFVARQEIILSPTLPPDVIRTGQFQVPVSHRTVFICDVDEYPHMRIQPGDLCDHARQREFLRLVVLGIESVVSEDRHRKTYEAENS